MYFSFIANTSNSAEWDKKKLMENVRMWLKVTCEDMWLTWFKIFTTSVGGFIPKIPPAPTRARLSVDSPAGRGGGGEVYVCVCVGGGLWNAFYLPSPWGAEILSMFSLF